MLQKLIYIFILLTNSVFSSEWSLQDMVKVKLIDGAILSPNRELVVAIVRDPANDLKSALYLQPLDKKEAIEVAKNGSSPSWSPDGNKIAFIVDSQIKIFELVSKKTETLTHVSDPITAVKWSPSGNELAFLTQASQDLSVTTSTNEEAKQNQQLWLISADGKSLRQLTNEAFHIGTGIFADNFAFSPDGKIIICPKMPSADIKEWLNVELVKIDLATFQISPFLPPFSLNPHFSPDGKWVAYAKGDPSWYFTSDVWIAPVEGGDPKPLAQTFNRMGTILGWSEDSQKVYVMDYRKTKAEIYVLSINGQATHQISMDLPSIQSPKLNKDMISFIGESCNQPQEVFIYNLQKKNFRQISQFNASLSLQNIAKTDLITFNAQDNLSIEALLTYPLNYDKSPFPLLVISHGGPIGSFKEEFIGAPSIYPIATFASKGFGVLQCNIRGSTGYGVQFRKANDSDWGGSDFKDLMAGIAYLKDQKRIDDSKMGIMGWSYGGYLTAWAITQTDQFKAASVGAGIINLISYTSTTDLPNFLPGSLGGELWEKLNFYLQRSPIAHVQKIHTPTLIQHGREDNRVPMGQSLELYQALKRLGIPTKIMLFPRTGHEVTETKILQEMAQANLDWFEKYIH